MDKTRWGVHQSHCCQLHGCKYGDEDCPVVTGKAEQYHLCNDCMDTGIKDVSEVHVIANEQIENKTTTVLDIIRELRDLETEKNNYADALKMLRSQNSWEKEIDSDGRAAVRKLYDMYIETKEKIQKLQDLKVIR